MSLDGVGVTCAFFLMLKQGLTMIENHITEIMNNLFENLNDKQLERYIEYIKNDVSLEKEKSEW